MKEVDKRNFAITTLGILLLIFMAILLTLSISSALDTLTTDVKVEKEK